MNRTFTLTLLTMIASVPCFAEIDLGKVVPDLTTPSMTSAAPAPGRRVKMALPAFTGTDIYHALYLPTDWKQGEQYPVIVEYAGNKYEQGPGTVESSNLGYGISAGEGVIWLCVPFVDTKNKKNATSWWGDIDATVEYCKQAVRHVCLDYGGDSSNVFIAGFSRGAIACNFIGLHDDEIASLWRGFICHSHYDGVIKWGDDGSDKTSAATRLKRLGHRPQFISHENSVDATRAYLKSACPTGNFTFQALPFPDHTDQWVLRDIPERKAIRDWFNHVLRARGEHVATPLTSESDKPQ